MAVTIPDPKRDCGYKLSSETSLGVGLDAGLFLKTVQDVLSRHILIQSESIFGLVKGKEIEQTPARTLPRPGTVGDVSDSPL